jgi:ATP-binding cassette subfamily E protein 1
MSNTIRSLLDDENTKYVIVVEHDLSILDYLSDTVCCLYGVQGAYGVVTLPFSVREGINVFLKGFIKTENMKFRNFELNFKINTDIDDTMDTDRIGFKYPKMFKKYDKGGFHLTIEAGQYNTSEIIVLLGENGTGKTTFVNMLAGRDKEIKKKKIVFNFSYPY